ncbi:hypothetical protein C4B63_26g322 [Trypanosoma cruzi]|uniref:Uncharacterized protein n=1 Tax=Trypanosoma cruzi TaxID=5693 RepID=A0A2V2VFL6_TRYCR|nr:hypothetical protein C4B63_26g322 [Trypanosoma cruzi]
MGKMLRRHLNFGKTTRWVGSVRTSMRSDAIACTPVRQRLLVLQILAVSALFISLSTLVAAVVRRYFLQGNSGIRLALIYCVAICFIILTVESSIGINVYTFSLLACGEGSSYHSRAFELSVGFALTIAAWAITAFCGYCSIQQGAFFRETNALLPMASRHLICLPLLLFCLVRWHVPFLCGFTRTAPGGY